METNKRTFIGLILIILGLYFLLNNFNLIPFTLPSYLFKWQMILIILGVVNFASGNLKGAVILTGIGVLFYVPEFFPEISIRDFWPVILLIVGASFFLKNRKSILTSETHENELDELVVFGGKELHVRSKAFQGGVINTIFGGAGLNFSEAEMNREGASLNVFTMFGGLELRLPEGWVVRSSVTPIFGGFSDKQKNVPVVKDGEKVLTVSGMVIFGGIEVKYV